MLAMLCVGWRPGIDFLGDGWEAMQWGVRRCEPSFRKVLISASLAERAGAGAGGISSTCIEDAVSGSARLRTPPDAGMKPMKLAQNPENENGFAKLKPSPATDATQYLGGSEAGDERSRYA